MNQATATTQRLLVIHSVLAQVYGSSFPFTNAKDPLSQLVSALLSHRTKNAVSRVAYQSLTDRYDSWEVIMNAPTHEIESTIEMVTYPEQKAPRIQEALRLVQERNDGNLSLDFLAQYSVPDARKWLEAIPGVGAKTSAAILNFSTLRLAALVVDTHHYRVMDRVGILPQKRMDAARAAYYLQALLPENWSPQQVYDHHQLIMRHGQRVCFYRKPACTHCLLAEQCSYRLDMKEETEIKNRSSNRSSY